MMQHMKATLSQMAIQAFLLQIIVLWISSVFGKWSLCVSLSVTSYLIFTFAMQECIVYFHNFSLVKIQVSLQPRPTSIMLSV